MAHFLKISVTQGLTCLECLLSILYKVNFLFAWYIFPSFVISNLTVPFLKYDLHEVYEVGKETESRIVVTRGWRDGEMGVVA